MIISDKIYNQLLPTLTEEQLNILNSKETETSTNKASIRILSLNEWNKYIVSSTLDGSITAKDTNAWHWHNAGNIYHDGCPNQKMGIHAMYFELSGYNTSNVSRNRYMNSLSFYMKTKVGIEPYAKSYNTPTTVDLAKNSYIYSYYFGPSQGVTAISAGTPWLGYYEVRYIMSFRPVFQYIDNKKSENIFR